MFSLEVTEGASTPALAFPLLPPAVAPLGQGPSSWAPGPLPQGSSLSHLFKLVLPSLLVQGSRHLPLMLSLKPTQDFLPLHALCAFLAPNNN